MEAAKIMRKDIRKRQPGGAGIVVVEVEGLDLALRIRTTPYFDKGCGPKLVRLKLVVARPAEFHRFPRFARQSGRLHCHHAALFAAIA